MEDVDRWGLTPDQDGLPGDVKQFDPATDIRRSRPSVRHNRRREEVMQDREEWGGGEDKDD